MTLFKTWASTMKIELERNAPTMFRSNLTNDQIERIMINMGVHIRPTLSNVTLDNEEENV